MKNFDTYQETLKVLSFYGQDLTGYSFWVITACGSVGKHWRFGVTCCPNLQGLRNTVQFDTKVAFITRTHDSGSR